MIEFTPKRNMEMAACYGADPNLFNALTFEAAGEALSYCGRCTVTKQCEEVIRPRRSFYDGVASGRVWHNGVAIKPTLF